MFKNVICVVQAIGIATVLFLGVRFTFVPMAVNSTEIHGSEVEIKRFSGVSGTTTYTVNFETGNERLFISNLFGTSWIIEYEAVCSCTRQVFKANLYEVMRATWYDEFHTLIRYHDYTFGGEGRRVLHEAQELLAAARSSYAPIVKELRSQFERQPKPPKRDFGPSRTVTAFSYHDPVFSIDAHGAFGGSGSPCWSNSMEILSGERTNAMRPSRGGRLITTPPSASRWQVS